MMRPKRRGIPIAAGMAALALLAALAGCASSSSENAAGEADSVPATPPTPAAAPAVAHGDAAAPSAEELAERWGVELVGVRLTAADYMLDVRYKVLDPAKAAPLFVRANKAFLIHPGSSAEIPVYSPAKVGPLRSTNPPEQGRIYFIFFSNPQGTVHRGDPVTFKIGDFEAAAIVE